MARAQKATVKILPPPILLEVGDKVIPERSDSIYVVTRVHSDRKCVDVNLPGVYLSRFNEDVSQL